MLLHCVLLYTTTVAAGYPAVPPQYEMVFSLDLDGLDTLWCICLEANSDAVAELAIRHLCTLCLYDVVDQQLHVSGYSVLHTINLLL
jgi:hypothetical protein